MIEILLIKMKVNKLKTNPFNLIMILTKLRLQIKNPWNIPQ